MGLLGSGLALSVHRLSPCGDYSVAQRVGLAVAKAALASVSWFSACIVLSLVDRIVLIPVSWPSHASPCAPSFVKQLLDKIGAMTHDVRVKWYTKRIAIMVEDDKAAKKPKISKK